MFDERKLRNCFGNFATGVAIACTNYQDSFFGLTINSFSSVSLNPPLLLFSIDNKSANLDYFLRAKKFAISILSDKQLRLAQEFAKPDNKDKWQIEEYFLSKEKNPIFKNSLAFFDCKIHQVILAGDHHVIIGEIIDFDKLKSAKGLFYFQGQFSC